MKAQQLENRIKKEWPNNANLELSWANAYAFGTTYKTITKVLRNLASQNFCQEVRPGVFQLLNNLK